VTLEHLQSLRAHASAYGITLSDRHLELFRLYLDELWVWSRHMNLTGLATREGMVLELFLDSLVPAPYLPDQGDLLDLGSGAGFPALPLKICKPGLRVSLLEAHAKKVSFLRQVIRLLRLEDAHVMRGRIERDTEDLAPAGYDMITARAVASLSQVVGWCAPFLAPGGLLVGFLGSRGRHALNECQEVMERHGLRPSSVIPYLLPNKKTERALVLLRKED